MERFRDFLHTFALTSEGATAIAHEAEVEPHYMRRE